MRWVTEQEPRGHSHLAALRAQEHIVISGSVLSTHGSSKIVEPSTMSMIDIDPMEMERKLKEGEEIKTKISGGMKTIQVRTASHTPAGSPTKSSICICICIMFCVMLMFYFMK